jgi:malate synthase
MKKAGSLVDFGLYVFHNTQMMHNETAPYFLPKLEHYLEARWWNKVFEFARIFRVKWNF